ncbi:MAG: toxin-antitoxin system HicB family antitoxin [Deltaproteobacteria bacterium]|nr:toxin-antitoxin system HicB family antitoxin [Deltaproteobacteria bacterium]
MPKKPYKYSIIVTWSEEDQGWGIKVPELSGCFSFAKKINHAPKAAMEAIESWIKAAKRQGLEIPEPISAREYSGKFVARIDPELHRALAIKAKLKGESLNRFVEDLLSDSLKEEQL